MNFNNDRSGVQNEIDFVKCLNKQNYHNLNLLFQIFLTDLYGDIFEKDTLIYAWKNPESHKTDFFIRLQNSPIKKNISLKKGIKNSIHVEPISTFIHFLIENNIPKDIIIKYLRFHYADGSTNGTGKKRRTTEEYRHDHQIEMDEINRYFNQKQLIKKVVDRFIILGKNSNEKIDALIYGVTNDFIWIKQDDIYQIILSKRNDYSTGIHFGPLSCQPLNRCINHNPLYEKKRFCVQIKWYTLFDNILEYKNQQLMNKIESKNKD